MANIGVSEADGFIPEIWLNVALGRLKAFLTLQRVIMKDRDVQAGAFQVGDTLHLPKRGTLTVNDKAANTNYTPQTPSASTVDLTLNKHKEVTFIVESRAISTANQDVISGYVEDGVIAIAEQIDNDIFAAMVAGAGSTITGGSALTEANILTARKTLVDNKVPAAMKKFGVVATSQTNALLQIDRITRYDAVGVAGNVSDAMVGNHMGAKELDSSFGRVHGFELAESQLVPFTGGTPTSKNLFFAKTAALFASRELENPEQTAGGNVGVRASVITDPDSGIALRLLHSYQHLLGGHAITLDVLYGVAMQRPEHAVLATTTS